jgi:predicted Zn finger-like uncharacterized protein
MTMHTRCTHCAAVFRVTLRQLQSSSGQVRCGVCHEAFDAFVHLRAAETPEDDAASSSGAPQVDQGLAPVEVVRAEPVVEPAAPVAGSVDAIGAALLAGGPVEPSFAEPVIDPADVGVAFALDPNSAAFESIDIELVADHPETVSEPPVPSEPAIVPTPEFEPEPPMSVPARTTVRRPRRWPLAFGVALLLLILVVQVAFRFRTRIATAVPALRPVAERLCDLAGCRVPLPELSDRLVIETSDLRALDPARPNRVVLIATLRNTASVAQAHPFVELSFTDARDQVTARKVFAPQDYLDAAGAVAAGIGPHGEVAIRMQLDVGDLDVAGYRLYLFHR